MADETSTVVPSAPRRIDVPDAVALAQFVDIAESAADPGEIQRGYSAAARAFLTAGNMSLAQTALRSSRTAS
jgi:hypothetical protein